MFKNYLLSDNFKKYDNKRSLVCESDLLNVSTREKSSGSVFASTQYVFGTGLSVLPVR